MLVITRKRGQSVKIGADVFVTVLDDRNRPVRLGIHAPADVLVLRTELCERDGISETHTSIGTDGSSPHPPPPR